MQFLKEIEKDYPFQENKTVIYDINNSTKELPAKNANLSNPRMIKNYPTFKEDISRGGSEDDILVAEDVRNSVFYLLNFVTSYIVIIELVMLRFVCFNLF